MRTYHFITRNEGVTAIEFALIAPTLMLMLMGTLELMLIMFAQSVLEGASFQGSRTGKTGYVETQQTREDTIINAINARAGTLFDTNQLSFSQKAYSGFEVVGDPEPFVDANGNGQRDNGENFTDINGNGAYDSDMGASGPGAAGEVVVYQVEYPWPVFTPLVGEFIGTNGVVTLSARTVVQNEPF